ncbi:Inhibitor of apoptosis-promoting Bax1 family protein [Brugia pahangi]
MSATVPLLLEENIELSSPPSYKEAVDAEWTLQDRSWQRHWFFDFNFAKATANFTPVVSVGVAIRLGFLRKVFGILSLQLLITAVFCMALYVTLKIRLFLQQQLWIAFVSLIGSFILLFAMFIHARSVPLNYMLLVFWTIMQSITVGAIGKHEVANTSSGMHYHIFSLSFFDVKIVIEAVGLTALTVIGLFFYTLQSKRDFQSHWAALFSISMIFLTAIFVHLLIPLALFDFFVGCIWCCFIFHIFEILNETSRN